MPSHGEQLAARLQASSHNDDALISSVASMDPLDLLALKRKGGHSSKVNEAIRQRLQRLS